MRLQLQQPADPTDRNNLPSRAVTAVDELTKPEGSEATHTRNGIIILDLRMSKTREALLPIIEALMRQGFDILD